MRTMLLTAAAVLALGVGIANAQGIGATATTPSYGQKWAEIQQAEHQNATAPTAALAKGPSRNNCSILLAGLWRCFPKSSNWANALSPIGTSGRGSGSIRLFLDGD